MPALYSLAIETSTPRGSITLGRDDTPLATRELPPQQRHQVDLMHAIDQLCLDHDVTPAMLGVLSVSLGPGSFTGLRIALATVKMLALVTGAKVIGVPTLSVLAHGAPPPETMPQLPAELAVCLNLKKQTVYAGRFAWIAERWQLREPAALSTLPDVIAAAEKPLALLGDALKPADVEPPHPQVQLLPAAAAQPTSLSVWHVARVRALQNDYDDVRSLVPLYIREPEAVTLWRLRHGEPVAAG